MTNKLNNYFNCIKDRNFTIDAGDTSNCSKTYNVSAVAETSTGDVVCLLISRCQLKFSVAPIATSSDGVAINNYGSPAIGATVREAITNFNNTNNKNTSPFCKWGTIDTIVDKNGKEINL